MPSAIEGKTSAVKRKRVEAKQKPLKRARSVSSDEDSQARILFLESGIFESKKNYNNISTLIKLLQSEHVDSEDSILASIALCRIFTRFMASGGLIRNPSTSEKDAVVILWLRERYSEYKTALIRLLESKTSSSTALTLCMRMLKSEGTHLQSGQDYAFPVRFLSDIIETLLKPESEESLRREFSETYVEEYDDIRFYTFGAVE